jgi:protein-disulfide isomerase
MSETSKRPQGARAGVMALVAALAAGGGALAALMPTPAAAPGVPDLAELSASAGNGPLDAAAQEQVAAIVRRTIMQNPDIVPRAINEFQRQEVARVLASIRGDLETPVEGAIAGNPKGDVTVVEFFDFRCPYCRQSEADLQALIQSDANVRVVFRDFPVLDQGGEPLSRRAALAAMAAGKQGKYAQVRAAIYAINGPLTQEQLVAAVRRAGVDERRLADDMASRDLARELDRNYEFAQILGMGGTPAYVIGDQVFRGYMDAARMKEAVQAARQRTTPRG